MTFGVDIEPTNRCNAKCYFCPRDATPHQGLMTPEVFEQALGRCDELRTKLRALGRPELKMSLCGLGEPLLNRDTPMFVRRVREEGFDCTMSSNAALLDEPRAHALLEAGLQRIAINVGDRDADYEDIYKLPFERTRDNVLRFKELAGDACEVIIVLVDHRRDRAHLESMRQYWGDFGMRAFMEYEIMNRGGALFVDHMQFEEYPQLAEARELLAGRGVEAVCPTPFAYLFIGFDGQYYLCCSDWKKEVPLGSVADASFSDVMVAKLAHARSRQPVCKTCNLDPLNKLTEALRARDAGEPDAPDIDTLIEKIQNMTTFSLTEIEALTGQPAPAAGPSVGPVPAPAGRRTIPVTAI
jgi:MoaA/NifB/PqqE/SkfB family radical SAM enzyme